MFLVILNIYIAAVYNATQNKRQIYKNILYSLGREFAKLYNNIYIVSTMYVHILLQFNLNLRNFSCQFRDIW